MMPLLNAILEQANYSHPLLSSAALYIIIFGLIQYVLVYVYYTIKYNQKARSCAEKWSCCPQRRARFDKCTRRRSRGNNKCQLPASSISSNWSCGFESLSFINLHLPPPLPFQRRKRGGHTTPAAMTDHQNETHSSSEEDCHLVPQNEEAMPQQEPPMRPSAPCSSSESEETLSSSIPDRKSKKKKSRDAKKVQRSSAANALSSIGIQSSCSQPQTSLMDLARMQQWSALTTQATRRQAKTVDSHGLYPLHWACSGGPPVQAVQVLLEAYPRAVRKVDGDGSTALHFACHYGASAAVVELLVQTYPQAAHHQDKFGRTALYHAVTKSASLEVLQILVQLRPASIITSCQTPRDGKRYVTSTTTTTAANVAATPCWTCQTPLFLAWANVLRDQRARQNPNSKTWIKAELLLETAYLNYLDSEEKTGDSNQAPRTFQFLPAVIALQDFLPLAMLELAIQTYPDQVQEPDIATGRLPLAMAAAMRLENPQRSDDMIRLLLNAYTEAASNLDAEGQSPLVLAVSSGKQWDQGVQRLFQRAPDRLQERDLSSGLPLALLAATAEAIGKENTTQQQASSATPIIVDGDVDPFGLLLVPHISNREKSDWGKMSNLSIASSSHETSSFSAKSPEAQRLSTIYQLLLLDPSVIRA
jgi:ankyrin repeat protein